VNWKDLRDHNHWTDWWCFSGGSVTSGLIYTHLVMEITH